MSEIAIDFGGTNVKIGLLENGRLVSASRLAARSGLGLKPRLEEAALAVEELLRSAGRTLSDCSGVGIAMPGIVDPVRRRVLSVNAKYNDALEVSFEDWARDRFALPCVLENDAKAALAGEVAHGVGIGATDAVMMIFGTGIGTAAMMDGKLVRGRHHQAGCLGGHLATNVYGPVCNCGNQGCLEAQSGHWALAGLARERSGFADSALARLDHIDYLAVIRESGGGDAFSVRFLEELLLHWSAGIVNLIHAYDPELVIVSGGLMKSAALLLPRMEAYVRAHAWTPWGQVRLAVAKEPDSSVLLGLSRLLRDDRGLP